MFSEHSLSEIIISFGDDELSVNNQSAFYSVHFFDELTIGYDSNDNFCFSFYEKHFKH